jgi:hypothetical protein
MIWRNIGYFSLGKSNSVQSAAMSHEGLDVARDFRRFVNTRVSYAPLRNDSGFLDVIPSCTQQD